MTDASREELERILKNCASSTRNVVWDWHQRHQAPAKERKATDPSTLCVCQHPMSAHIYHEGACRPGFACGSECEEFCPVAEEAKPEVASGEPCEHHYCLNEPTCCKCGGTIPAKPTPQEPPKPCDSVLSYNGPYCSKCGIHRDVHGVSVLPAPDAQKVREADEAEEESPVDEEATRIIAQELRCAGYGFIHDWPNLSPATQERWLRMARWVLARETAARGGEKKWCEHIWMMPDGSIRSSSYWFNGCQWVHSSWKLCPICSAPRPPVEGEK